MVKQIIPILAGGLGNQLFQYCFALNLSKKMQANLYLDVYSGFLGDPFKRKFALESIVPECSKVSLVSSIVSILLLKFSTFCNCFLSSDSSYVPESFSLRLFRLGRHGLLLESEPIAKLNRLQLNCDFLRISGYWQSPTLFEDSKHEILDLFSSYEPKSLYILEMGRRLRFSESIAVGVRLYEETANPELNAHNRQIKTVADLNTSLSQLLSIRPNSQVAVFCSHRSPLLRQLSLPSNVVYLTGDDSVPSAQDTLWLMAQCKHHVFLNSTLYWWAAFFSQLNHAPHEQIIYAPNNFINQSCYLKGWHKF